jgi:hypothetical protein
MLWTGRASKSSFLSVWESNIRCGSIEACFWDHKEMEDTLKRVHHLLLTLLFGLVGQGQGVVQFNFPLTACQVVPWTDYTFEGVGSLTLDGDSLSGDISFLVLPWSAVGFIRGPARAGESGPILFNLGPPGCEIPYPPWDLGGCSWYLDYVLTKEQVAQISSGLWYVEVTSNECPNGLVRGQILPSTPVITRQPVGGDVLLNYSFSLSAEVIGSPTPSMQWRFKGTNIAGATGTNYTFQPSSTNQTGAYTLLAWNTYGTNLSNEAYVKVWTSGSAPLLGSVYTNSQFVFHQSDVTNYYYIVQATTNVAGTNWVCIQTNQAPYTFTDPEATNYPLRFYRTLLQGP